MNALDLLSNALAARVLRCGIYLPTVPGENAVWVEVEISPEEVVEESQDMLALKKYEAVMLALGQLERDGQVRPLRTGEQVRVIWSGLEQRPGQNGWHGRLSFVQIP